MLGKQRRPEVEEQPRSSSVLRDHRGVQRALLRVLLRTRTSLEESNGNSTALAPARPRGNHSVFL